MNNLASNRRPWSTIACIAVIVLCGLAAHSNSFDGVMTFDDSHTIKDNPRLRLPSPWPLLTQGGLRNRPVLGLSFWLNYRAGGLDVWGYHAANLAIHLSAAVLIFLLVRRTLVIAFDYGPRRSNGVALSVAVLWVVHPLSTTAVTYICQRGESMMALFYLAALCCFIRAHESKRLGWAFLSVLCAFLAVGTKQVALTIPLMCLLYDHLFLTGSWWRSIRDKWYIYLGLFASWVMMAQYMCQAASVQITGAAAFAAVVGMSRWDYFFTETGVLAHYFDVALWPRHVSIDPFFQPIRSFWDIGTAGLLTLGLGVGTLVALRRKSLWAFLGVWAFVILLPTSSFLPMQDAGFDYRFYLPLVAVIVAAVFAGRWFMFRLADRAIGYVHEGGMLRTLACGLALALVASLLIAETRRQNDFYRSEMDLWLHVARKDPLNPRAHLQVGAEYHKMGEAGLRRALDLAGRAGTEPDPKKAVALAREAGTLREKGIGRILLAMEAANEAIRLYPHYMEAYNNRSRARAVLGDFKGALKDADMAMRTTRLGPTYIPAIINRANAYLFLGEMDKALADYGEAEKLAPDNPIIYHNRAMVFLEKGRLDLARADCERCQALGMEPNEKVLKALEEEEKPCSP